MKTGLAIAAMVLGSFGHLVLLVLCVAGMANASEGQMRDIQRWMLGIGVAGVVALSAAILLLRGGYPLTSVAVALITPIALFIAMLVFTTP